MSCAGFIGVGDPPDCFGFSVARVGGVELVEEGEDGSTRVAVDYLDVVFEKLGVDDVGGGFTVEGVEVFACGCFGMGGGGAIDVEAGGDSYRFPCSLGVEYGGHRQRSIFSSRNAVMRLGWNKGGGGGRSCG